MNPQKSLTSLIQSDQERMKILSMVRDLNLPDCYVAAGFVRNAVWDALHGIQTPLSDVDVVFYDAEDLDNQIAPRMNKRLMDLHPELKWDVKNQALMHVKNFDDPYRDTLDAMSYWPEKETAVGVALDAEDRLSIVSAFGLESLLEGMVTHNPKRSKQVFIDRVNSKHWLEIWPQLRIIV